MFPSPLGVLTAESEGGAVVRLVFGRVPGDERPDGVLARLLRELGEYFRGARRRFTVPFRPHGTAFQLKVWMELRRIPYGKTRTYQGVARGVGSPRGFRAVGQACRRNPVAILIPCHRVVGGGGALTGFSSGLGRKKALLALEDVAFPF